MSDEILKAPCDETLVGNGPRVLELTPVAQACADAVGADGHAADASTAVRKAEQLLAARRAALAV